MDSGADTADFEKDAYRMDLYSRQIGAYGVEAMAKLVKMKVLIVGLRGVGIEVAKNLILAGPGAVTVCDDSIVETRDLGSNFFLREEDVGKKTRAEASVTHLKKLNRLVNVSVYQGKLTQKVVSQHTVVVDCGMALGEALKWDAFCRKTKTKEGRAIGFVKANVRGLAGYAFVDFGPEFAVHDKNGEQPVSRIIDSIEISGEEGNKNEIIVHLIPPPDGQRHNMEESKHDGWIRFEELEGDLGVALNDKGPFEIKHCQKLDSKGKKVFDAYSLRVLVPNASKLPAYSGGGGTIVQVKRPVQIAFRSLEECLNQPISEGEFGMLFTDGAKFGRAEQLHMAFRGLWQYESQHGDRPPPANDESAAEQVAKFAADVNTSMKKYAKKAGKDGSKKFFSLEELDVDVSKMLARHAMCELQPLCAFFGGVVAQEVVKMTGKFTPLNQWLHIDCFEVLPDLYLEDEAKDALDLNPGKRKPENSRYDDLIMILGKDLQQRILGLNTFMIGCGALGCELLKNFALLGVGCDPNGSGKITVTDNDRIEVSNLSRQFLFREENVGQPKSVAACAAARQMNQDLNVEALEYLVAPNTEDTFNDEFWTRQDFITNALDNVKARLYVDGQCVFYGKPLLESGTLGTKCNVQVILPDKTQSYADGPKDNENENNIPMCTLRNFPSKIEHCIEWARAQFTDLFVTGATEASNFLDAPEDWLAEMRAKTLQLENQTAMINAVDKELGPLRDTHSILMRANSENNSFVECVKDAYALFHKVYRDKIFSLISTYPEDAKDNTGNLFWSGTKRFPQVAEFDANNETHMNYIISVANILAVNYGLQPSNEFVPEDHPWRSPEHVGKLLADLAPPPMETEEVDMSGGGEEDAAALTKKKGQEADHSANLAEFESMLEDLEKLAKDREKLETISVEPADFEKDEDRNFHIDFITATSNLRAWNYRMKPVSRHKAKMIAGRIIPAIATTTAAVTGLVMIELLKLIQQGKKLEAFKDSSNSLGINGYFFSEPVPPVKARDEYDPIEMREVKCQPPGFTKWDKTVLRYGDLTLAEFLERFKADLGVSCTVLLHPAAEKPTSKGYSKMIYERDAWQEDLKAAYEANLNKSLVEIAVDTYGAGEFPEARDYMRLDVSCEDDEGNGIKIPEIVYYFK